MRIDVVRLEAVKDRTIEYGKRKIKGPKDLAELGFKLLSRADRESTLTVCLNANSHINALHVVSIGSLTTSIVHPREVYKLAILSNSVAIALLHNHPSGNIKPSTEDVELTDRLIEVGKLLGIKMLDHVIVGDSEDSGFYSLVEHQTCNFE